MTNFNSIGELEKHFSQGCGINVSKDRILVNVYNEDDTVTTRIFSINQDGKLFEASNKPKQKKEKNCEFCGSTGECSKNCECFKCSKEATEAPKKEVKKSFWK